MARESAQTVAATQEEVEKVQVVTWEGVDPSVAERRVAHRGATYLAFTKPRIWVVFAVEAAAGAMLASPAPGLVSRGLVGAVGAVALAGAGAECLTNVIDRSIDARMQRTRNRPLPSGALDVAHATALGLVLVASSLVIGSWLGAVPLGLLLVGLFDNVIIYSALAKRDSVEHRPRCSVGCCCRVGGLLVGAPSAFTQCVAARIVRDVLDSGPHLEFGVAIPRTMGVPESRWHRWCGDRRPFGLRGDASSQS